MGWCFKCWVLGAGCWVLGFGSWEVGVSWLLLIAIMSLLNGEKQNCCFGVGLCGFAFGG